VGGDASLDFVDTIDWAAPGTPNERLFDYDRLTRWAEGAGILLSRDAARLRRIARSHPRKAEAALAQALRVRSVLERLFRSVAAGDRRNAAWGDFNDLLAGALRLLEVKPEGWSWRDSESLAAMLPPVLWSAARLLTSDEARQIRICAGPDCGWMYVDRSRNGLRRWCAMETCGTREKSRRRRERHRRRDRD
jgi:predicted RNA-binding Zn ribbon-like protein